MERGSALLCRACQKSAEETNEMINLFEKERSYPEFNSIGELFSTYTFLNVAGDPNEEEEEAFMLCICIECYEILINFHKFRKMCAISHLEMLKLKHSVTDCFVSLEKLSDNVVNNPTELINRAKNTAVKMEMNNGWVRADNLEKPSEVINKTTDMVMASQNDDLVSKLVTLFMKYD